MRVLHLVSCRGWSSDAYWAARIAAELTRRGHDVTVAFRAGTESRVIARAQRDEHLTRTVTLALASGLRPASDVSDVRRLGSWLRENDVVHVHRGKEHWLAALAARVSGTRRPIVRTRHIAQSVRSHAGNRWLYGRATDLVVTVTDAIRRQMIAGGVVTGDRVVTLAGGVDADRYSPGPRDPEVYRRLGGRDDAILVGMVAGFRLMKGHTVVVDAAARLRARGVNAQFVFVGQGPFEARTRAAITALHLDDRFTLGGFADDLPAVMRALDVALYVPLESEGMSRVLFEVLASGRAVIASRVGIAPERLVDDDHALLVAAGDAAPLADALMRIVNDPGLRQRLGGAARRLVETDCSGARVAAVLETHYEQLARRSTRRAA